MAHSTCSKLIGKSPIRNWILQFKFADHEEIFKLFILFIFTIYKLNFKILIFWNKFVGFFYKMSNKPIIY